MDEQIIRIIKKKEIWSNWWAFSNWTHLS